MGCPLEVACLYRRIFHPHPCTDLRRGYCAEGCWMSVGLLWFVATQGTSFDEPCSASARQLPMHLQVHVIHGELSLAGCSERICQVHGCSCAFVTGRAMREVTDDRPR